MGLKLKGVYSNVALIFSLFAFNAFAITELETKTYKRHESFYDKMPAAPKGGTLYYQLGNDPKVMNPLLSDDSESSAIESYLWMPLFTLDAQNLNYLPALATSYSISGDQKNYTFTLNHNAKWQDGTPVTSEDIKFSFDTLMNPKTNAAALRSYYDGIKLEVIDATHFTFKVEEPRFDTLNFLVGFTPIQKKQFALSNDFNKDRGIMNPIGNAAYIMEKYERGQQIVFKRNKNWWGYSEPHYKHRNNIDEVVLRIIPDTNLAYEKFVKHQIDEMSFTSEQWNNKVIGIDKEKYGNSQNSGKNIWALKIENQSPKAYTYIGWNFKNKIFQNIKTRTAFSHLVDYKKIIEKVYYNLAIQTTSPFGSLTANSASELRDSKHMIKYDRAKAMFLLKEAGWMSDGSQVLYTIIEGKKVPFEFTIDTNTNNPARLKIAQIIKEDFKAAGIKVNIRTSEWNSFLETIEKRSFDAVIMGWTGVLFPNAKQLWDSSSEKNGGSNFISYSNPKIDELIKKANLEFDSQKRNLLMQDINRLIYADQPYTFLAEGRFILEGLNSKINSSRWVSAYESGAASDLFYMKN